MSVLKNLSFRILICVTVFTISSCKKPDLKIDASKCIEKEIRKIGREPVRNPPAKVWEWKADGKIYYYITSDCCDRFNYLYDSDCNMVCAPDGGLSGQGDKKCPDFKDTVQWTLVWEDGRVK